MSTKNTIMRLLSYTILFLLSFASLESFAQNNNEGYYIELPNASGYQPPQAESAEATAALESAATAFIETLPTVYQDSIRVYGFGFYRADEVTSGGFSETMQRQIDKRKADKDRPYYLLFGKESNSEGLYTGISVDIHLPKSGIFECLDIVSTTYRASFKNIIKSSVTTKFAIASNGIGQYVDAEIEGINALKEGVLELLTGCPNVEPINGCYLCGENLSLIHI